MRLIGFCLALASVVIGGIYGTMRLTDHPERPIAEPPHAISVTIATTNGAITTITACHSPDMSTAWTCDPRANPRCKPDAWGYACELEP